MWRRRRPQTEKLSPQPHSPLTFGFLKRKASFSPCLTKSTLVPSMSARLVAIDEHLARRGPRTPRSSGAGLVGVVDDVGEAGAAGLAHAEAQADAVPAGGKEALDAVGGGFGQGDGHRSLTFYAFSPVRRGSPQWHLRPPAAAPVSRRGTPRARAQSAGVPGCSGRHARARAAARTATPPQPEYGGSRRPGNGPLSQSRPPASS